jgi:putative flippase GtrA
MPEQGVALRFVWYSAAGAVGTMAHYAILFIAVTMGWLTPASASACGALVGAAINFLLNAHVTFGSGASWPVAWRFAMTAAFAAAANGLAMAALLGWFRLAYLVAQVLVTAGLLMLTFLVNSLWTFRPGRTS